MPRPRKSCRVSAQPVADYFKPRGVPMRGLEKIDLPIEGFEALRLADLEGLKQEVAARQMSVSRATFQRVLARARQTVARALIEGLALRIEGGHYSLLAETDAPDRLPEESEQPDERGAEMEKIAVTTVGPTLDDLLDPRFGRAAGFIIIDPATMEFEYLDNGVSQTLAQGAGIQAAENVAQAGATVVLTGFVGPKAFRALSAAKIKVGQNLENISVREAVERYNSGQVEFADQANKDSHWS